MKTVLHCDANNFYASVETIYRPELKGKPIAVSGNPDKRHGIILAKSDAAKACGIKTGETIWQAKQKCPDLQLFPPRYNDYVHYSNLLFGMYTDYTDRVEPFGIDECWLDCTESCHLFGGGKAIADTLRERAKAELGLTISVGVSFTKIFAKLGSDIKKPDGTTVIDNDNYKLIAWRLPISDLLMVGRKTKDLLSRMNIATIGDLAIYDRDLLIHYMGINGQKLHNYANGIPDDDEVRFYYNHHIPDSIGNSTTTPQDMTTPSQAHAVIVGLSDMVATRLRQYGLEASGISLHVKYNDLKGNGKQMALSKSTSSSSEIADHAIMILNKIHDFKHNLPIRAIGISTYKLTGIYDYKQLSFLDEDDNTKLLTMETAVDKIREKYGYNILKKGIVAAHNNLCGDLEVDEFQPFKK